MDPIKDDKQLPPEVIPGEEAQLVSSTGPVTPAFETQAKAAAAPAGSLAARRLWQRPVFWFWLAVAAIFIGGAILRTLRIDMPPLDFPSDRQKSNMRMIEAFISGGASLFGSRSSFVEIGLYPWIVAHTRWICAIFNCELWTLARIWALIFGMITVGFAGLAGYWLPLGVTSSRNYRLRSALIFMAAMAFDPYHIRLSRMITTESLTMACQAAALAFFLMAWHKNFWRNAVIFLIFFMLSGMGKIPSMIWLPGYFLYLLFSRQITWRVKGIGLILAAVGVMVVFAVYRLNPFTMFQDYATKYSHFSGQALAWMHNPLWIRSYIGRTVMMVTFPGAILAVIGFLVAPWLFRLTLLCFLIPFFFLNNLNTYNFCHVILPGLALAVYGANLIIDRTSLRGIAMFRDSGGRFRAWLHPASQGAGALAVLAFIYILFPLGPNQPIDPKPRGDIIQAVDVIRDKVPADRRVITDEGSATLSYMLEYALGRESSYTSQFYDPKLGDYYMTNGRFTDRSFLMCSLGWVHWASIPGEFNGLLINDQREGIEAIDTSKFSSCTSRSGQQQTPFEADTVYVPRDRFDPKRFTIAVKPGDSFQLGIKWRNLRGNALAGVTLYHEGWKDFLPVPLRTGGFATNRGGVLCIPPGETSSGVYTIEVPKSFPVGKYRLVYYPLLDGHWDAEIKAPITMPFQLVVTPRPVENGLVNDYIECKFQDIYPMRYDRQPTLWTNSWFYKDMVPDGVTYDWPIDFMLSTPGLKAGNYRLTVRGSGVPITDPDTPDLLWPTLYVYAMNNPEKELGNVAFASEDVGDFSVDIQVPTDFDMLKLQMVIRGAAFGKMPIWLRDFQPRGYGPLGQQFVAMRSLRFERLSDQAPIIAPSPATGFDNVTLPQVPAATQAVPPAQMIPVDPNVIPNPGVMPNPNGVPDTSEQ